MNTLESVDWSQLPQPSDDGGAAHLPGKRMPQVSLASTSGRFVDPSSLEGVIVVYAYPMTGRPGRSLPDGWDMIPGARGCTPQSCAFRDHFAELQSRGVAHLFGLSTQPAAEQRETADRLHLPFPLLSDAALELTRALELPTFEVNGAILLKRLSLIIRDGLVIKAFYPVFPPDRAVFDVMAWFDGEEAD
ncbi:peroxiredoxin [Qipengyuania sp. 6D47A]|uniref:Peroxiredoxin n=2 Tax=Qipengyuania qiaonensis TaxID=2867240 RepID=A0ABS7J8Z9_9SPHN|nr:peroxiredoxin [Qipengyuania qiaonensis]